MNILGKFLALIAIFIIIIALIFVATAQRKRYTLSEMQALKISGVAIQQSKDSIEVFNYHDLYYERKKLPLMSIDGVVYYPVSINRQEIEYRVLRK